MKNNDNKCFVCGKNSSRLCDYCFREVCKCCSIITMDDEVYCLSCYEDLTEIDIKEINKYIY